MSVRINQRHQLPSITVFQTFPAARQLPGCSQRRPFAAGWPGVGRLDGLLSTFVSCGGRVTQPSNQVSPPSGGPVSTPAQDATVLERALFEVKRVIVGQDRMIERMFVSLLSRGHVLLEGVPGVAKTLAVETLAKVVGGTFSRIQFTPDLVPADIVGTRIYRQSSEKFDVELGPVFVNFLLADEINRAPAKVQSALLEVMAEQHVTIGHQTYDVPTPFFVIATQNPIESEGVYQLPEAQRDRFMMKITMSHPSADEEMTIVDRMSVSPPVAKQVID